VTFDLKSRASSGVVLFNSGGPLYTDFVAVELVSGHVTLRVNKGGDDVTLTSRAPVHDGEWHRVRAILYSYLTRPPALTHSPSLLSV